MMETLRALIVLHRTFRRAPVSVRLHALVRFLTCPFGAVLRKMAPRPARVLEIGAGHGVFSRLALEHGAQHVTAVEPDLRKVLSTFRHPALAWIAAYDDVVGGTFDVVAIVDVLYKIPANEWDPLFERVAARLQPGGVFLLKEQDPTQRLKNSWNRLQEVFASALGLTLGESFAYETPSAMTGRLRTHGFRTVEIVDAGRWYPHPHILYVATK